MPGLGVGEAPLDLRPPRDRSVDLALQPVEQQRGRFGAWDHTAVSLAQVAGAEQGQGPLGALPSGDFERQPQSHLLRVQARRAQPALHRIGAVGVDVLQREPEHGDVALVPVRRHEHGRRVRQDLTQQVGDGGLALRILADQVGDQLHAEGDVALLVAGDVGNALPQPWQQAALGQRLVDEVLAGLSQRRLDHDVVERDRLGELGPRAVAAQLVGHLVQPPEHLAKSPGEPRPRRGERRCGVAAGLRDLAHEAREQHRVTSLVDLLGGEEVLLFLARGRVDERRQVVGHRVLAVEEHRVRPQGGPALEVGERVAPVIAIGGEVDLAGAPVALLPALVQILVGDLVCGDRRCHRPKSTQFLQWCRFGVQPDNFGDCQGVRSRRSISSPSSAIAIRTCARLSRSRSVTVRSSSDWWSIVTAHGVPISSWRR